MGEERCSSPSVCLHDFFAQKFDGVLFNARYIAPRLLQTMPGITRALISGNIIGTPAFRARSGNQPRGQEQLPSRSKGQGGAGTGAGRIRRAQPYPQPKRVAGQCRVHFYEHPMPVSRSAPKPEREKPVLENPTQEKPAQEDPMQLKKQKSNTIQKKRNQSLLSISSFRKSASWTAGGRGWNIRSSITCCRTTRALLYSLTRSWP